MIPIVVSPAVWAATLEVFVPFVSRGVEGGCFWYADVDQSGAGRIVSTIGVPTQVNFPRNFRIPADALAELNQAVPSNAVVVAQLHSHPGDSVAQSPWDDELIVSRGIVSIVLPRYARFRPSLRACGLHIFDDGEWRAYPLDQLSSRLIEVDDPGKAPGLVDLR